jgi:hypothetical protein
MPAETTQAGRELDALVAEKVMGWAERAYNYGEIASVSLVDPACQAAPMWILPPRKNLPRMGQSPQVPEYSTSISAAWLVVEAMQKRGFVCDINVDCFDDGTPGEVSVDFWKTTALRGEHGAATAPLAICLAALRVVERHPTLSVQASGDQK